VRKNKYTLVPRPPLCKEEVLPSLTFLDNIPPMDDLKHNYKSNKTQNYFQAFDLEDMQKE